ncbi:hypothetical protein EK21DRAFT_97854 [Setomelanomma holmii]|uniref:Uncharacterized protein n=1 Tax=Setomelanomma holmii TaxID=210430 RepID=A0A9P4HIA9_9PLEO|nr:hypothetical protein EK21DRAFT_97854 [Setomelanomma holmii]
MHTTERHRNKRPFQPSITSFFARDASDSDDDNRRGLNPNTRPRTQHHASKQRETLAPPVPAHVQADLLQVGMRVRKSVPEGYKTQLKISTLPTITTTLVHPSTTSISLDVKPPRDPVPDDFVHQRELLPFCGLHKIGGYAEQPTTNIHLYAGGQQRPTNPFPLPAEAFSQPFSSQGSTDSGYVSETQRKRSWQDDDDARLDISGSNFFFAIPMKGTVEVDEVPVSPLSESPQRGVNMLPAVRQFAQPKSSKRVSAGSGSDFEEADFLAVGDVGMGGKEWAEAQARVVELQEAETAIFEIWIKWIYTGQLFLSMPDDVKPSQDGSYKNSERSRWSKSIDAHVEGMLQKENYSFSLAQYIYPHSLESSNHRKLAVDMFIHVWGRHNLRRVAGLPTAFAHDIIIDIGALLPRLQEDVSIPDFFAKVDTCKYHDHGPDKPCYKTKPTFGY